LAGRTLEQHGERTIQVAFQRVQLVFDVFSLPELARLAPGRQLAGGMRWHIIGVNEHGDFLETRFQFLVVAHREAERRKYCEEGWDRL